MSFEKTAGACWACGGDQIHPIFEIESIPLSSLILLDSEEEARSFPRGALQLVICQSCGFIYNNLFQPELVDYSMPYESSQDFSPRFREFKTELIDHLVDEYDLVGKTILEIGCGDGSFLAALCERARATGFCIDPTFDQERVPDGVIAGIADYFDSSKVNHTADLICCRHTLEHIQPVGEFVGLVRGSAESRPGSVVFFEIPDTDRILDEGAFWDVYYEHCSYFTLTSLSRLFRGRGFDVLRLDKGYADQYLLIDCVVGPEDRSVDSDSLKGLVAKAKTFGSESRAARAEWRGLLKHAYENGQRVVLWGASSKAVSFIASMDIDEAVAAAVDINPFKQEKFLPGSGHPVIAPHELSELKPDLVIVMNPIYVDEIDRDLTQMGLAPRLVALGGVESLGAQSR